MASNNKTEESTEINSAELSQETNSLPSITPSNNDNTLPRQEDTYLRVTFDEMDGIVENIAKYKYEYECNNSNYTNIAHALIGIAITTGINAIIACFSQNFKIAVVWLFACIICIVINRIIDNNSHRETFSEKLCIENIKEKIDEVVKNSKGYKIDRYGNDKINYEKVNERLKNKDSLRGATILLLLIISSQIFAQTKMQHQDSEGILGLDLLSVCISLIAITISIFLVIVFKQKEKKLVEEIRLLQYEKNRNHEKKRSPKALFNIGKQYFITGTSMSTAIDYFTDAITLDAQQPKYYEYRADAYSKLGYFNRALEDYQKAISLSNIKKDDSIRIMHKIAKIHNETNNIQESESYFKKAYTILNSSSTTNPKEAINLLNDYCILLLKLNKNSEAEVIFKKAIEIREQLPHDNPDYQNDLAETYRNFAIFLETRLHDNISAKENYEKAIEIREQLPKDNPDYQNGLAETYRIFAIFLETRLHDNESAKENYEKAIEIREQLPKDNPDIQNDLAETYRNYAILLETRLHDYISAKKNYEKAIEIREQLPKDNPEYQNGLAQVYRNYAIFFETSLNDYGSAKDNYLKEIEVKKALCNDNPDDQNSLAREYFNLAYKLSKKPYEAYDSAKENYQKSIEIREQLPKNNPEFQNDLAGTYNNLAVLQENHFQDFDLAKENYQKAIEIGELFPTENPKYQDYLARAYNNLALLQENHFQDYVSAKENYQKAIAIRELLPKDNPEYQDNLALIYNHFAYLLKDYFKDYQTAKENCNKAIEIVKQLSNNNPEKYRIYLFGYKHSLADICFDNNEIETAKSILDDIQKPAEKCLEENPNDEWTKTVNNDINELLKKINNQERI